MPSTETQPTQMPFSREAVAETPTNAASINEATKALITEEGGIFIGKDELVKLGKIPPEAEIPALPEKVREFLLETHPIRDGKIASHVILAFDPDSNEWVCIDRGEGGRSDIVPKSLGPYGDGLSGADQDELLREDGAQINVHGADISSPVDSYPVERVLNNAIALHLDPNNHKPIETAPFYGKWGRTADTDRAEADCRVLLGSSYEDGTSVHEDYRSDDANLHVGLLAAWSIQDLYTAEERRRAA